MTHIGNPAQDAITAGDTKHRDDMAIASLTMLNAIEAARTGKAMPKKSLPGEKLLWDDGSGGGTFVSSPFSRTTRRQISAVMKHLDEKDRVRSLTVKRDPCPMCGVRMDVGCKHRRAA